MSAILLVIGSDISIGTYLPVYEKLQSEHADDVAVISVSDERLEGFLDSHKTVISDLPGYGIATRAEWNGKYMRKLRGLAVKQFGVRRTLAVQSIVLSEKAYSKLISVEVSRSPGRIRPQRPGVKYVNVLTLLYDLGGIFSKARHVVYVARGGHTHAVSNDSISLRA